MLVKLSLPSKRSKSLSHVPPAVNTWPKGIGSWSATHMKKTCETATLLKGGCRSLPSATFQAQDTISQSLTSTSSSVMTITLGRASVKNQKHVTRLAPKTDQEKWLQKVMLGLCSKLTGWGVLKPHSQLTQAAIHHARCPKLQSAKGSWHQSSHAKQCNCWLRRIEDHKHRVARQVRPENWKGRCRSTSDFVPYRPVIKPSEQAEKTHRECTCCLTKAGPQKGHHRTHGKLRTLNVSKAQRAKIELFHWNLVDDWPRNRLL